MSEEIMKRYELRMRSDLFDFFGCGDLVGFNQLLSFNLSTQMKGH